MSAVWARAAVGCARTRGNPYRHRRTAWSCCAALLHRAEPSLHHSLSHQISGIPEGALRHPLVVGLRRITPLSCEVECRHGRHRDRSARADNARLRTGRTLDTRCRRDAVSSQLRARCRSAATCVPLRRTGRGGEKPAAVSGPRPARFKAACWRRPPAIGDETPLSKSILCRPPRRRSTGPALCVGGCFRVAEPYRDIRTCTAGGAGVWTSDSSIAGGRSTGRHRRQRRWRVGLGPARGGHVVPVRDPPAGSRALKSAESVIAPRPASAGGAARDPGARRWICPRSRPGGR